LVLSPERGKKQNSKILLREGLELLISDHLPVNWWGFAFLWREVVQQKNVFHLSIGSEGAKSQKTAVFFHGPLPLMFKPRDVPSFLKQMDP